MNKIDRMIEKLCPNGVEFKLLGDVMSIARGASPRPIHHFITTSSTAIPWIKIGDVDPRGKYVTHTAECITEEGALKSRFLKKGDFILSNSMSFGRPYILGINGCIHDGWISMSDFEEILNPNFLYYLLRSAKIQNIWKQKASSGTVSNLNVDIVRKTQIPVPPLEIQEEIVKILDNFTELEAELEARKKQYEYYRNVLLAPDNFKDVGYEWKTLGEIGDFIRGNGIQKKDFTQDGVGCIHYGQIYTYYGMYANNTKSFVSESIAQKAKKAQYGDLILATTSENIEDVCKAVVWLGDDEIAVSGDSFIFRHTQNSRYIAHNLKTFSFFEHKKKHANGTKVIRISSENLKKYKIPIPSKEEQERIASILDKFDALVNDISQGLPAEITARRKQYEYYREKLLTFKKLDNE